MPPTTIKQTGENALVARLGALAGRSHTDEVIVGPGDDCAALAIEGDRLLLLACDMMAEGIHFRREWATPWQLGWKAVAQNISDVAAMGGAPFAAVASISAPGTLPEEVVAGLAEGMHAAAARYGAALVGGDLVGSMGPLVLDVAITGWVTRERLLLRSGAQAGDVILVTNALGGSAAGLAALQQDLRDESDELLAVALRTHFEPQPRVREAQAIAATGLATAMMDLSDGLAEDLPRLCQQSGLGAHIRAEQIPIAPSCSHLAERLQFDAMSMAVTGGEDYELLVTCPPRAMEQLQEAVQKATGSTLTVIGKCTSEPEVVLVDIAGSARPLGRGFDHFADGMKNDA